MQPIDHRISPKLQHVPLHPPRASIPKEGLYLALWQQFAEQRPEELSYILGARTNGPIRQRAASVAASFMVFMGCNGGGGFTYAAERMAASGAFSCAEDAYLAAWAIENKRVRAVNSGLRTAEYMLAREYPIHPNQPCRVDWPKVPDVTQEDMDVLEAMVAWWSSPAAQCMREAVEAQARARQAEDNLLRPTGHKEST